MRMTLAEPRLSRLEAKEQYLLQKENGELAVQYMLWYLCLG